MLVYICGMLAMWPPLLLINLLHFMFYVIKNRKEVKIDAKCFMLVCRICINCLVGMNYSGSRGRGVDPVKRVLGPVIYN